MGKKETFSIISRFNKINRGKITKEGNQFGFELFEGYPGSVSRCFFFVTRGKVHRGRLPTGTSSGPKANY